MFNHRFGHISLIHDSYSTVAMSTPGTNTQLRMCKIKYSSRRAQQTSQTPRSKFLLPSENPRPHVPTTPSTLPPTTTHTLHSSSKLHLQHLRVSPSPQEMQYFAVLFAHQERKSRFRLPNTSTIRKLSLCARRKCNSGFSDRVNTLHRSIVKIWV